MTEYERMEMLDPVEIPGILYRIGDIADLENLPCYLVGGYVRDLCMQRPCTDIDVMVIGEPVAFARRISELLGGRNFVLFERFRTAQLELSGDDGIAFKLEIVGARKESYNTGSRKPVTSTGTLEDDLSRRDFTVNSLALRLNRQGRGELVDLFEGVRHIGEKLLVTPLDPEKTFSDDPLRMMRAARFSCQLDFRLDEAAVDAMTAMHERIRIVSRERISHEFLKIMQCRKPSIGLELLHATGLLKEIIPELDAMAGVEQVDGLGHKDTLFHTFQVVDNIARHTDKVWLRVSALFHDIAKPVTKRFSQGSGWTFHGHEAVGVKVVARIFRNMKWPLEPMEYVQKMVRLHHRPIPLSKDEISDSAVRRLMFEAGTELEDLMTLCRADVTSKNPRKVQRIMQNFANVEEKIAEVGEKDLLARWRPPVSGHDIMQMLRLTEGRLIGVIKSRMENAIIDGKIPYDRQAALDYVMEVYRELQQEESENS
jgi:poly(A) polymerase